LLKTGFYLSADVDMLGAAGRCETHFDGDILLGLLWRFGWDFREGHGVDESEVDDVDRNLGIVAASQGAEDVLFGDRHGIPLLSVYNGASLRRPIPPKPDRLRLKLRKRLLEAGEELIVTDDNEEVVVFQEILPRSGTKIKFTFCCDLGCSGKAVEIASVFAPLGNFEIGEGLRLWKEYNVQASVIRAEAGFAFDAALQNAVLLRHKDTTEFSGKDAADSKIISL
jgi:hypothetical protein